MARISKSALTRLEIIRVASGMFLEKGYSSTTIKAISGELGISTGNLTFYFPSKEHLLAELTEILGAFQWELMSREADEGMSSLMAFCLELAAMAAMCEENAVAKDFYLAAYTSPMALEIIRRNDADRARRVFGPDLPDWREERFRTVEVLVSGIEYATLMTTGNGPPLETRIAGALNNILQIFQVPEQTRQMKIARVLAMDYRGIGRRVFRDFLEFTAQTHEQVLEELLLPRRSIS